MSVWSKIKQWIGIGGVKVELHVPPSFSKKEGMFEASLTVTSKSDQTIQEIKVVLDEEWTTGRGEEKTRKIFELGMVKVPGFDIKTGDSKTIQVAVPFQLVKSNNDELKEKGGALGSLGKLGALASAEKSEYHVIASADVLGTAFGPSDKKSIRISE